MLCFFFPFSEGLLDAFANEVVGSVLQTAAASSEQRNILTSVRSSYQMSGCWSGTHLSLAETDHCLSLGEELKIRVEVGSLSLAPSTPS